MTFTGLALFVVYLLGFYVFSLYTGVLLLISNDSDEQLEERAGSRTIVCLVWPVLALVFMLLSYSKHIKRRTDNV